MGSLHLRKGTVPRHTNALKQWGVVVITLIVYTVTSLLCAFSQNLWLFVGLRFVQGFAGAAGIIIAHASAQDMYVGKDLTQFIALLALVNGAAPILAHIFGGAVLNWVSSHAVFIILSLIGLLMFLAVVFFLSETLPPENRSTGGVLVTVKTFGDLLKDKVFISAALLIHSPLQVDDKCRQAPK